MPTTYFEGIKHPFNPSGIQSLTFMREREILTGPLNSNIKNLHFLEVVRFEEEKKLKLNLWNQKKILKLNLWYKILSMEFMYGPVHPPLTTHVFF